MTKVRIDPNVGLKVGMVISSTKVKIKSKGKKFGEDEFVVTDVQRIKNEAQEFGYGEVTVQLMGRDGKPDPKGKTFKFHAPVIYMHNDEIPFADITVHRQMKQTFI